MAKNYIVSLSIGLFLLLFIAPINSHAIDFIEDFNTLNTENWTVYQNNGSVDIKDGILELSAPPGNSYPYLTLKENIITENDFIIKLKFKITGPLNYGSGIALSDHLIPNGETRDLAWDDLIFLAWPQDTQSRLFSNPCPITSDDQCQDNFQSYIYSDDYDKWITVDIVKNGSIYKVSVNDNEYIYKPSNLQINTIWIGNYQRTGSVTWGKIYVDYLYIKDVTQPTPNDKIILLPGHGACWNYQEMFGVSGGENKWSIPSWVHLYDNFINSIKANGLNEDSDYYVFCYDWRKNLDALTSDLDNYISGIELEENQKIDLVGHSYGGLVARAWRDKIKDNQNIDQLITVGSPHEGVIHAYGAWEGGEIWGKPWWQKAALGLLMEINKQTDESRVEEVRRLVPSIKDLLPNFDYLSKLNGEILPYDQMEQQNLYLANLDKDASIETLVGTNKPTWNEVKIVPRSWLDELLDKWEDGKPTELLTSMEGDGTVLKQSAQGGFEDASIFELNHGELIAKSEALQEILTRLGLDETKVVEDDLGSNLDSDKVLIAMLRSPGKMMLLSDNLVIDGSVNSEGNYVVDSNAKIILIPGFKENKFEIKVLGDGEEGEYELLVGYMDEQRDSWLRFVGTIATEDEDSYNFDLENSKLSIDWQRDVSGIKENLLDLVAKLGEDYSWIGFWKKFWLRQRIALIKIMLVKIDLNNKNPRIELARMRTIRNLLLDIRHELPIGRMEKIKLIDQMYEGINIMSLGVANGVKTNPKVVEAYGKLADRNLLTLERKIRATKNNHSLDAYLKAKGNFEYGSEIKSQNPQGSIEMFYSVGLWTNYGMMR